MARPIKDTPVLKGNDAKRFIERKKQNDTRKASPTEIAKMKEGYSFFKKIAKF